MCINIFILNFPAFAKSKLQFKVGDKISVFAKKAIRRDGGRIFEAIGNTVILHGEETLYGHAARFDMNENLFEINGNVRYLTKDLTLYGTYLNYNAETEKMHIDNARMFTPDYRIVARKVEKTSVNKYVAYEAEFTTCKDCTESWTIYGEEVEVTINEYVKIKNALMRIKGVDAFYLPYLVFPIKADRETGLLFPRFSVRNSEGFSYAQPWFWAINQSSDLTATPTIWSERGLGGDVEFRKAINNRSFYKIESRYTRDDLYLKDTDQEINRYLLNSELNYRWGDNHNSYFRIFDMSDLDFPNDNPEYSGEQIIETEYGSQGFYNYRNEFGEFGFEASVKKSLLREDSLFYNDFFDLGDNSVSILPRVEYAFAPFKILKSKGDFFNLIYLGGKMELTDFRQNHFDTFSLEVDDPIRNAVRLNVLPHIHLSLYDNGTFNLGTTYELGFQHYNFRREDERDFRKYSGYLKTDFSFGIDRVYGLAYKEKVKVESDEHLEKMQSNIIGELPSFSQEEAEKSQEVIYKSYKHIQNFNFIHHFVPGEEEWGNQRFLTQISEIEGWFDYQDAIRSQEFELGKKETRTQISPQNTFEFQWNHSLIEKSPKNFDYIKDGRFLKDNFGYKRVLFFNLSQGLELNEKERSFEDRLTRLGAGTGVSFGRKLEMSLDEYYFHKENTNITTFSMKNDFDLVKVLNEISSNDFSDYKIHKWGFDIKFSDEMVFLVQEIRYMNQNVTIEKKYAINYAPENDCWLLSFGYRKTINAEDFSIDFALNLGNPSFYKRIKRIF